MGRCNLRRLYKSDFNSVDVSVLQKKSFLSQIMSCLLKVCSAMKFHNVARRDFARKFSSKLDQLESSYQIANSKKYVDDNHEVSGKVQKAKRLVILYCL